LYSHLPFAQELLYTMGLLLQGDTLAKLISWTCGVGLTFGTAALGQRLGHPRSGAWTAALLGCTPAVLFNGRVTGTENALALWCLRALWAVLRWRETVGGDKPRPYAWLILAGVFGGLATGTKYVGVFACAVLGVMILTRRVGWKPALIFAGVAAIVFIPWPIRTAILSGGNPLHPYFSTILRPDAFPPGQLVNWMHDTRGSELIQTWTDYLLHPWILTVNQSETPHHVGPWPLALAPLALWARFRRRRSLEAVLAAFAVGYWALWAPASMGVRFLMPAFAPLGLAAWIVLITSTTPPLRQVAFGVAAVVCLIGINRSVTASVSESGWRAPLGQVSRDEFLRREQHGYGFPPYAAYERMNRELSENARVLLIGETRGAYLERRFLAGDSFDWPPAADLAAGAADGEAVYRR
ncbi:MAG: phospholipid carrier-dependent glycosyltransferase, partial [bacterium]